MFLSDASVRRPIAMGCLIIGLTLLGLNAWRTMGLELMPKMDVPFITVTTIYPGASPEQIETDVAKRIEDKVMTLDGLKHVSSACMENMCLTFLEFELDVDVDIAASGVRTQRGRSYIEGTDAGDPNAGSESFSFNIFSFSVGIGYSF